MALAQRVEKSFARELRREHARVVQSANNSIAMNVLYPYPVTGVQPMPLAVQGAPATEKTLHVAGT